MQPNEYLLPRPPVEWTAEKTNAFEHLWNTRSSKGWLDYRLLYPKWEFLSYLGETHEVVLHGSQNQGIEVVEPRQANDARAFSNQRAIYATTDGIWVIYFAILDRQGHRQMTLFNSCLQARIAPDRLSEPMYFFSITQAARVQQPWCEGAVYILPRGSFQQEGPQTIQGMEIVFPHWIGPDPAEPEGRMRVGPADFPFLAQIHGHDNKKLVECAAANPDGFPWPEAWER